MIRPKAGFFFEILCQNRLDNVALEAWFFAEKIVFSKRKTPKFSRLRRGYTPNNPQKFRACGATLPNQLFKHIDVVQNNYSKSNYSKCWRCLKQLFYHNYSKYWRCSKSNYSKTIIRIDVVWTELFKKFMKQQNGQISKQFQFYRRLSRSLHMHKTLK